MGIVFFLLKYLLPFLHPKATFVQLITSITIFTFGFDLNCQCLHYLHIFTTLGLSQYPHPPHFKCFGPYG